MALAINSTRNTDSQSYDAYSRAKMYHGWSIDIQSAMLFIVQKTKGGSHLLMSNILKVSIRSSEVTQGHETWCMESSSRPQGSGCPNNHENHAPSLTRYILRWNYSILKRVNPSQNCVVPYKTWPHWWPLGPIPIYAELKWVRSKYIKACKICTSSILKCWATL